MYFEVWQDAWGFHKKYEIKLGKREDFWGKAVTESSELMKKYSHKPQQEFMKMLLVAVMSELQKSEKGG